MSNFRCSSHCLNVEKGRHQNIDYCLRFCNICLDRNCYVVEDEFHFVLVCPVYNELRLFYFQEVWTNAYLLFLYLNIFKKLMMSLIWIYYVHVNYKNWAGGLTWLNKIFVFVFCNKYLKKENERNDSLTRHKCSSVNYEIISLEVLMKGKSIFFLYLSSLFHRSKILAIF